MAKSARVEWPAFGRIDNQTIASALSLTQLSGIICEALADIVCGYRLQLLMLTLTRRRPQGCARDATAASKRDKTVHVQRWSSAWAEERDSSGHYARASAI
ncbi:hypothetical protein E4U59_006358 [Claviceps monticola]|nr:hypothetical protein E4U59_006358 [Claviceps monticola]